MSILALLAERNKAASAAAVQQKALDAVSNEAKEWASLECEAAEAYAEVDGNLADLQDDANVIDLEIDDLNKHINVGDSLNLLVDGTVAAYGETGMDEQGAALLRISVESVLRAANINSIPASLIVPSFESGQSRATYSTEAEEKKDGILQRIFKWVAEAFKKLVESVKDFFGRMFGSVPGLKTYATKVHGKLNGIKGTAVEGTVGVHGISEYLIDNSGKLSVPKKALHDAVEDFQSFAQKWQKNWTSVNEAVLPTSLMNAGDAVHKLSTAAVYSMAQFAGAGLTTIKLVPAYELSVKGGPNPKAPMMGCKVTVTKVAKDVPGEAPILDREAMKAGITEVDAALALITKVKTIVDAWIAHASKLANGAGTLSAMVTAKNVKTDDNAAVQLSMKSLVSGCGAMSKGWTSATRHMLLTIKANIRYIEVSAGKHTGGVKEFGGPLAIGHDK